jgi:hypothetical protein
MIDETVMSPENLYVLTFRLLSVAVTRPRQISDLGILSLVAQLYSQTLARHSHGTVATRHRAYINARFLTLLLCRGMLV